MKQKPQKVFLESLGVNIDLKHLTILERVARQRRCSVEELILQAVYAYAHGRKSK